MLENKTKVGVLDRQQQNEKQITTRANDAFEIRSQKFACADLAFLMRALVSTNNPHERARESRESSSDSELPAERGRVGVVSSARAQAGTAAVDVNVGRWTLDVDVDGNVDVDVNVNVNDPR